MQKKGSRAFNHLSEKFLETFLKFNPDFGIIWGIPKYDYRSCNFTLKGMKAEIQANEKFYKELKKINVRNLSKSQALDHKVLEAQLQMDFIDINSQNRAVMSPQDYMPFEGIGWLFLRNVKKTPDKTSAKLSLIPTNLRVAKKHLEEEIGYLSMEWVRTAIEACEDGKIFLKGILTFLFIYAYPMK